MLVERFVFDLIEQLIHFQKCVFIAVALAIITIDGYLDLHLHNVADGIASFDGAFATIATVMDHGQVSRDGKEIS